MNDKQSLRKSLKSWLEQESLTESEFLVLQNLKSEKPVNKTKYFSIQRFGIALTIMCVIALNAFWLTHTNGPRNHITQEILTNHLKIKPLDLATASIGEMQQFFERLDFSPFISDHINFLNLVPEGGRYCTLQGNIALQMRLKTLEGNIVTYYQSRYDEKRFGNVPDASKGNAPDIVVERGVKIRIWREQGIIHVLAQSTELQAL